jgi:hypothetical protein
MDESKKAIRKAYRAHARAEFCKLSFWVFAASLYAIIFLGVALLIFADGIIGSWFFNVRPSADETPLLIAYHWANLIEAIFLIAIAVLYMSGGLSGIPLLSHKNENLKP